MALSVSNWFSCQEYKHMSATARSHNGFIAGDVIPGHTGAGADWLLALLNFRDYPYLYHMVSVKPEHWVPFASLGLLFPLSFCSSFHKNLSSLMFLSCPLVLSLPFYLKKENSPSWSF